MRNNIKIISVLLCLVLLVSALPMTAFAAQAGSGEDDASGYPFSTTGNRSLFDSPNGSEHTLTLNETYSYYADAGSIVWVCFVPDKNMFAAFKVFSRSCISTTYSGELFDSDIQAVAPVGGSSDYHEKSVTYKLRANKAYYFRICNNTEDDFSVRVTFAGDAVFADDATPDSEDPHETAPLLMLDQIYNFHSGDNSSSWFRFVPDNDMDALFHIVADSSISTTFSCNMLDSELQEVEPSAGTGDYNELYIHYMLHANKAYYFHFQNEQENNFSISVKNVGNAYFVDDATPDTVYPDMQVGNTQTVTIRYSGDVARIRFVPERDMNIIFYSSGDYDTYGMIQSSSGSHSDDDGGEDNNFRVLERVKAGVVYTLAARLYDAAEGSFDVTLEESTAVWSYEDDYNYGGVIITGYYGDDTDIVIPATIDERPVTSIGHDAFGGQWDIESVVIPEGVRQLGSYAFEACYNLTDITFPDSLQEVGYNAFYMSKWYDDQPDGMVYAGRVAHRYKGDCPTEVTVRDGTAVIGTGAFSNCLSLTSITVPESVVEIKYNAFYNCPNLLQATILGNPYIDEDSYLGYYYYEDDYGERNYYQTDGFTLYGYSGTSVEAYADAEGFTFVAIIPGDVDGDEEVGVIDATYIQRYEAGFSIPISEEDILLRGDVDGDGEVTVIDATYIQRYDAGFSIPYPIGKPI